MRKSDVWQVVCKIARVGLGTDASMSKVVENFDVLELNVRCALVQFDAKAASAELQTIHIRNASVAAHFDVGAARDDHRVLLGAHRQTSNSGTTLSDDDRISRRSNHIGKDEALKNKTKQKKTAEEEKKNHPDKTDLGVQHCSVETNFVAGQTPAVLTVTTSCVGFAITILQLLQSIGIDTDAATKSSKTNICKKRGRKKNKKKTKRKKKRRKHEKAIGRRLLSL